MKRPRQLPAVDRNTRTAAIPVGTGVRPSFGWGDLGNVLSHVAQVGLPILAAAA